MTLNKKSMLREIGRRTRLRNRDVQAVIDTLVEVWTEELVAGGRIEIENFSTFTLRVRPSRNEDGEILSTREKQLIVRLAERVRRQLR